MNGLTFHPLAEMFPLIEGTEFDELVASIKENGLREPIITLGNQILDGRNRYRACQAAGVAPMVHPFTGRDPVRFVIDKNINRRHLNESQRALIAAGFAALKSGQRSDRADQNQAGRKEPPMTRKQAADLMHVSESAVKDARKVLAEGTQEEIEAVRRGKAFVSTLADEMRAAVSPEKRKNRREASLSNRGKNPERIQNQQIRSQIWSGLRDAVVSLSGMPLAADVVAIVRQNDKSGLVDARLSQALQWLERFAREWNGRKTHTAQEQDRDGHSDAGTGDATAGSQSTESAAA